MTTTDTHRNIRQRVLELIEESGISDRQISQLATGNTHAIRNIRRSPSPRLHTLEAACRVLGCRLEIVPFDGPEQPAPAIQRQPGWSRRLREEIRGDLVEIFAHADKGGSRSNGAE